MIIDFIGKSYDPSYKGSLVIYGRDYILESANELLAQYQAAKAKGAPVYELNALFQRYLLSKHQNNPMELALSLKMLKIEPLVHYTLLEASTMRVSDDDLKAKIYFSDWYNSKEEYELISAKIPQLKEDLQKYVSEKDIQDAKKDKKEGSTKDDTNTNN